MEKSAEEADGGLDVHPKTETTTPMSRKEKRKAMKKMKRKQARKEIALKDRQQQDDPQELLNMKIKEQEEAERSERDRKLFEERERAWIEAMELRNRKRIEQQQQQIENANEDEDDDDNLEYEKEERAEFIWQGNEITLIKKKVRVPKRDKEGEQTRKEDSDRPTSNPLPPQSEAFSDHKYGSLSAQQLIENVAEQVPHFGTEKDKDHCPFHLKTGACRFGHRCSRVHFYPDKSSTLLIRNMYNGPGLAWEQDEGLEQSEIICEFTLVENQVFSLGCTGNKDNVHQYTDEEVERSYEEFYEDVHTEFLKFGEIINFKVCRNGAFHLRGNVYVQYSAVESAVLAHQFISGRYFAGKQISCEFINVTKWKAAICGEYAKSNYQTCSRGTACNFIHCFRNPGADYEWADRDKSPPKYWVEKMVALFGYSDVHKKYMMDVDSGQSRNSGKMSAMHSGRYGFRSSSSRERNYSSITASGRRYDDEDYGLKGTGHQRPTGDYKYRGKTPDRDRCEENTYLKDYNHKKSRKYYTESDGELLDRDGDMHSDIYHCQSRKSSRQERDHENKIYKTESDGHVLDRKHNRVTEHGSSKKSSSQQRTSRVQNNNGDCKKKVHEVDRDWSTTDRDRESYHGSRSSGHKRKAGYADDHKYRKSRAHDSDRECSDSNSRDDEHHSMRKSLGHIDNASKYSLDRDAEIEASHARKQIKHPDKLDGRSPAQDQKHKNSGDEADDCVKDLRAHDSAESYRSDQNNVRYITDVQIGKPDRWEPEPGSEERHDSEGKAESFESCKFRRSERHNRRDESSGLESESYSIDKVGEAHHHENRMSRKKSSNNNGDRAGGKRSRGTSQFSHRRCSNSSGEATDSADDDKESRRYKKHHASHKPHNSRDLKSHH